MIKVGGSLCIGENGPKHGYFSKLLPVLKEVDEEHKLSVGVGGGKLVRSYAETISNFNLSDQEKEECFIRLISANVKLLSYLLNKKPLFSFEGYEGGEVVIGGITPGRSTDSNAAMVAEKMNADKFLVLTDVDGIYNKDPDKYTEAEKIDKLSFEELDKFKNESSPLHYGVVDPTALDVIQESKIETHVINGKNPSNILKALTKGKVGTKITG